MKPYEYLAVKFANQWGLREEALHKSLSASSILEAGVAKALHYFQVARTFRGLSDPESRGYIAARVLDRSKGLTAKNYVDRVNKLAGDFESEFGSNNLSAASKLLWLRARSPVLVYDKWARLVLERVYNCKIPDYKNYCEYWRNHYSENGADLQSVLNKFGNAQKYTALHSRSAKEFHEIISSEWFAERVFDMYLLTSGKNP